MFGAEGGEDDGGMFNNGPQTNVGSANPRAQAAPQGLFGGAALLDDDPPI